MRTHAIPTNTACAPVVLLLLLATACSTAPEQAAEETPPTSAHNVRLTPEQRTNAGVATSTMERRSLGVLLPVQGVIEVPPQNLVSVSAPLGGYLRSTDLLPGMEVQQGQALALLEDARFIQLQQDYLVAQGRVDLLRLDFERQKALNASKTTSDKVFQEVSTELNTQTVTLRALAEQLRLIGIDPAKLTADNISRSVALRSPIHGWVSSVKVNIGRYVQPTDVLFELVDPKDIHLALTVFEKDLPKVREGQEVHARPTAHPQDEYEAEVILVGRSLDSDRSTVVHCHFTKAPRDLVPGMAMSATLESRTDSVWCVPEGAVVRTGEGQAVFIANADSSYTLVPVTTGAQEYGFLELLEPPAELRGRPVVVEGAYTLLSVLMNSGEEE
ncbi:MAG TPA: efflux RND transporter periplasmic adaptor subunit [Flavobacteriales bacterium]|nr:efflux RND transporter periplasmic adaptor subunit [Flavobacteriales bacterium]HMR26584.1 efflux RND transporter periplasmic adaptor subunit [Flavobacteriales bacterium]